MTVLNTSRSSTVQRLAEIWGRLLQISAIQADDNFFDLGGDSAIAVRLFSEVAEVFGKTLPPVMIYHVPTISSLADVLEQQSVPELSPVIPLREGHSGVPVFIAPGLGGGPAEFFQLVKYIQTPNPIYGLQPKGIEGFDEPCKRIEEMADFYLKSVRTFQPEGPYILLGYSLGGLVVLEMAKALISSGQKIALLLMIDSYPDINSLPPTQFLRLLAQRMKRRVRDFGRPPRTDVRLGGLPGPEAIPTFAPAFERVRDAAYQALRKYRPTAYLGPVKFIRATEVTEFPEDVRATWSELIPDLDITTVPGDHLGMLTTQYEKLASVLNGYLESALQSEDMPKLT